MMGIDVDLDRGAIELLETLAREFADEAEALQIYAATDPARRGRGHLLRLLSFLDADYDRLQAVCRELGIGKPEPETTTEGAPVTEVEVEADSGKP